MQDTDHSTLRRLWVGGLLGSLALSLAGVGAGAVPKAGSKDVLADSLHLLVLREHAWLKALCVVVAYAGILTLLVCWWRLWRRLGQVPTRLLLLMAATWAVPLAVAPPLFSADIYAYAGQGHLVANGVDAYEYGPGSYEPTSKWSYNVDGLWRYAAAPYGPLWLRLAGGIVDLSHNHMVVALYLLRAAAVAGLLLVAWGIVTLCRYRERDPRPALWLAVANPLVLIHGVAGAHNDFLMLGLAMAGLGIACRRGPSLFPLVLGTSLVVAAGLVKAPALLALAFLPFLVQPAIGRLRAVVAVALTGVLQLVLLTWAAGLGWGWLEVVRDAPSHPSVWSPLSGAVEAVRNVAGDGAAHRLEQLTLLALLAACAWFWHRAWSGDSLDSLGRTLLAVPLLSLTVQPWYLLWGATVVGAANRSLLLIRDLAIASTVLSVCLLPAGRTWLRSPLYGLPVLIALVVIVVMRRRTAARTQALEAAAPVVR